MPNAFAHIELTTSDLKKAKQFYKKLFDWTLSDMVMEGAPPYTMIATGEGPGGGMQAQPMPNAPIAWLTYVEVDNIEASLAKAAKNGAKVMLPATDIGKMGSIGIFSDPAGASLGLWSKNKLGATTTAKKSAPKKTTKSAPAKAAKKSAPKKTAKSAPTKAAKKSAPKKATKK